MAFVAEFQPHDSSQDMDPFWLNRGVEESDP